MKHAQGHPKPWRSLPLLAQQKEREGGIHRSGVSNAGGTSGPAGLPGRMPTVKVISVTMNQTNLTPMSNMMYLNIVIIIGSKAFSL